MGDARATPGRAKPAVTISPARFDAVVFDMDGVVTDTASVHAEAWRRLFDEYLARRPESPEEDHRPFTLLDYQRHVDGKPRHDGVADFLASRGITLPPGDQTDPPGAETVTGLGSRKDRYFNDHLATHGVTVFGSTVDLLDALDAAGVRTAVITASRNAVAVLGAAGLLDRFAARVDGVVAARLGLPGKPQPDVFLEAARRLGAQPARTVVVEDAEAGVDAGRRGGFGLVLGVDRTGHADALYAHGADVVVTDLAEVAVPRAAEPAEGGG
jgi:alpha,alpha-trehalase